MSAVVACMRVPFLIMVKYFHIYLHIFMNFAYSVSCLALFWKKLHKCLNARENALKMWLAWEKYKVRFSEDFDNPLSETGFWHTFSAYFFHENLSEIILHQLTINMFQYQTFFNSQEAKPSVFLNSI